MFDHTCFINSIISSSTDSIGWEELVANSHLLNRIVNKGNNGWLKIDYKENLGDHLSYL